MAPAPEAGATSDPTSDYNDESVTIEFALTFNIVKCATWWLLWLLALGFAFLRRRVVSRAWFIFISLLLVICFNAIQSTAYTAYASHVKQGHTATPAYLVYLLFFNVARSAFLAVLLVVASGYCITRSDLGPHRQHVLCVPATVLITGLVTDFSFFALQTSQSGSGADAATDSADLTSMSALEAGIWFICSVLNLAALILAWLYLFEALGREQAALDEDYKRRTGALAEEQRAAAEAATAAAAINGYNALQPGLSAAPVLASSVQDPEAGGEEGETVADHMAYTRKKKLLSRFGGGIATYLVCDICVLLLPAFFNTVVQSTLQSLLFAAYLAFIVVLLVLFRPQEASSYLMVGFNEEDAEARGVNQLATGIAMAELELGEGGHAADGEGRAGKAPLAAGPSSSATAASAAAARRAERAERVAAAAARKAAKIAGQGDERYLRLPGAQPAGGAGDGAGGGAGSGQALDAGAAGGAELGLPVSTAPGGAGSSASYGLAPLAPPPRRQPRYVPQPKGAGPFTLDDEDDSAAPLTGPSKAD